MIGFYGVDNPPEDRMDNISTLFSILGHFLVALMRRRDLFKNWKHLSFYDELTGFGNRHAMDSFTAAFQPQKSIGVVYCDVNGLKRVNDEQGHKAGDALLVRACGCIKRTFAEYSMFRIGGDEFLVLCDGIEENALQEKVKLLKADMQEQNVTMAIGAIWRPNCTENIDKLLTEADKCMYEEKKKYYENEKLDRRNS
jgi:diguanylate cyclase (GGDEF)-like protein